jgi:SNF2 family DNA or RNA helicase
MLLTKLRPHQDEAVEKAMPHPGFGLWMEQRTGKTLTALAIVNKRKPRVLFIVTIKKGKRVWEEEIKKSLKIDWKCEVIITHFQAAHKDRKNIRKRFREQGPKGFFVICDESHLIKRRGSQASRLLRYLGEHAQWRLALSGTPLSPRSNVKRRKRSKPLLTVTDGLEDAWAQYNFIDPSIFGSAEAFEDKYLKLGGFRGLKVIGYKNRKKFQRLFHQYSYRKLLGEVQEKRTLIKRTKLYFELKPKTRTIYDQLDKGMFTFINGRKVTIPLILTKSAKLQQIAGGFFIDREEGTVHKLGTEKLGKLRELLEKIFSQHHGEKVVICANFIHEIKAISRMVSRMGLTHQVISGKTSFDGKFKVDVTVIQIQSGVAIDLSEAGSFIFYSLGQKYIDYEQARFRILSYTKRQANFYYLLARRTMDELVYEAQTRKKSLVSLVIDHYRRNAK